MNIELYTEPADLAGRIRRAGQAKALYDLAKDLYENERAILKRVAELENDRTGTGFSHTVGGVRATLSDPQPKPHVTDKYLFVGWLVNAGVDVQWTERVEVTDHRELAKILGDWYQDRTSLLEEEVAGCFECLKIALSPALPADPFKALLESGRCFATDDGLIDTETGEIVPGVECTRAAQTITVNPSKGSKARDRTALVTALRNASEPKEIEA